MRPHIIKYSLFTKVMPKLSEFRRIKSLCSKPNKVTDFVDDSCRFINKVALLNAKLVLKKQNLNHMVCSIQILINNNKFYFLSWILSGSLRTGVMKAKASSRCQALISITIQHLGFQINESTSSNEIEYVQKLWKHKQVGHVILDCNISVKWKVPQMSGFYFKLIVKPCQYEPSLRTVPKKLNIICSWNSWGIRLIHIISKCKRKSYERIDVRWYFG